MKDLGAEAIITQQKRLSLYDYSELLVLSPSSSKISSTELTLEFILPSTSALIELKNFACERDERMLFSSLNATFYAGQVVQILGANGSGKTTLLRILAGVSQDYHGDILWRGQTLSANAWEFASESLYLGHLPGIKKSLTALENLRWYAALQGGVNDEVLLQALADVKLAGYEDTLCYQLSAGQLRRVALARLAFSQATLWILDEPFTALDKAGVAQLEARLASHASAGGLVLVTSHQDINLPRSPQLNLQQLNSPQPNSPQLNLQQLNLQDFLSNSDHSQNADSLSQERINANG